jgi:hypothetical protein
MKVLSLHQQSPFLLRKCDVKDVWKVKLLQLHPDKTHCPEGRSMDEHNKILEENKAELFKVNFAKGCLDAWIDGRDATPRDFVPEKEWDAFKATLQFRWSGKTLKGTKPRPL